MKLQRTYNPNSGWLFLAPITDIALLLMFLLLLCTSFVLQPGIAIDVPQSPFLLPPQQDPLVISITAPPLPTVFFDNQKATLKELGNRLESRHSRTRSVIVKADKYAPSGLVTDVLNQTLRYGYSVILATQEKP